jgi:hypothetical protein
VTQYRFPEVKGGQEYTADFMRSLLPLWVIKDSNTDRASTTTFADDPEFKLENLLANAVYNIQFAVKFAGDLDGDIKTNWTLPTGATGTRLCLGPGSTANQASAAFMNMRCGAHGVTTSVHYSATRDLVTLEVWCWERAVIRMGTVDGDVVLSWAQAASSGTATRVSADGWGIAERII